MRKPAGILSYWAQALLRALEAQTARVLQRPAWPPLPFGDDFVTDGDFQRQEIDKETSDLPPRTTASTPHIHTPQNPALKVPQVG